MAVVNIRDVCVSYGDQQILNSVSLTMESGKFVAVLGPSGCGKTTLLRVVAGFAEYSGSVEIDGKAYDAIPPHKRNIGIVFQDYALFPHRSVEENIAFGLRWADVVAWLQIASRFLNRQRLRKGMYLFPGVFSGETTTHI